ncbi:MAG: hypothetical protein HY791_36665 [Deltaproteobacteria bacterium]|nr:hypothetical protein [Deltaproteobacteria bacterium]
MGLATLAACGSEAERVAVALPDPVGSTKSFVLLVDDRNLYGGTLDEPLKLEQSTASRLELAYYDLTLEELGLRSGFLEGRANRCRSCLLLKPPETHVAEGLDGEWTVGSPSDGYLATVVPDAYPRCACAEFDQHFVPIPVPEQIAVVAALREASGSALVVIDDGSIVRVREDFVAERLCSGRPPLESAALAQDGQLWVSSGAELRRLELTGSMSATCTVTASVTGAHRSYSELDAIGNFVVGVTGSGAIVRSDGASMATLAEPRPNHVGGGFYHVRAVSSELVVATVGTDSLLIVEDGVVDSELVRRGSLLGALTSFGGGVMVSMHSGLAVRRGDGWSLTDFPERWSGASALIPFDGGVIAMTEAGSVFQINSKLELCPGQPGFSQEQVYEGAPFGASGVLLGDIRTDDALPSGVGVLTKNDRCE